MDLGGAIYKLRKEKEIKQVELADRCEISQAYLSQIENNRKEPHLSTLSAISKQLETPLPILFFLALNEQDIPEDKRDAFALVSPSLKSLISDFY